ncbi:General transcription factor II-I repeat domain containing protein 2A [Dissostichus eleginoides]|uniref:General transcription factor II-I repeat domain containing protein 2A n=1 Tax=Dissostichus eleginoides TaxID=100907 RepID=A0AAD9CHV8_DISEL|nr:General transcription factor II-I repeat domain containing protein 2A [Dissostichus eleginoides]
MLPDLVQSVFAFVNKLKLFKTHLQKGELAHFPSLLKASAQATGATRKKQTARYATLVETLQENFATRFHDLHVKRPQITFLVDPFNAETDCLKAPLVKDEAVAELEMIELSEDDRLKPVLREGTIEFWKTANREIPQCQTGCAQATLNVWVNIRLELLRVATTEYKPDLRRIVQSKECQKSH